MKTNIHCPHCQSKNVHSPNKTVQVMLGIGITIIGLGFLLYATTTAVGYYLFALPLCTLGSIRAYKGYYHTTIQGNCKDCRHEFEYIVG